MKILKSCKNEAMKEKKLSKAERLFARVQEMKVSVCVCVCVWSAL